MNVVGKRETQKTDIPLNSSPSISSIIPNPAEYIDGLNTYTYVKNNPVRWIDLLGLETVEREVEWSEEKGYIEFTWQGIEYKTEVSTKAKAVLTFEIAYDKPEIRYKGLTEIEGVAGVSASCLIGIDVEEDVVTEDVTSVSEACENGKVKHVMDVRVALSIEVTITVGFAGFSMDLDDYGRTFEPKTVHLESDCFPIR